MLGAWCPTLEGRRSADLQSAPEHRQSIQQGNWIGPNKGTGLPGRTASALSTTDVSPIRALMIRLNYLNFLQILLGEDMVGIPSHIH